MADANPPQPPKEVEVKLLVDDARALDAVARAAGGTTQATVRQVNTYFDTRDMDLHHARHVVRLRREADRFFVTAKGPSQESVSAALTTRVEDEFEIDSDTARRIEFGDISILAAFPEEPPALVVGIRRLIDGKPLERIGSFENERTRITARLEFEVVIELDRTTFPGDRRSCEVELEAPGGIEAERALRRLFERAGVEGSSAASKAKRFFAALEAERERP